MKLRASHLILYLLMILSPLALDKAMACSCMQNESPCSEAGHSDAVFVGKVVGSKERKTIPAFDEKTGEYLDGTVTYDVGEIYFEVKEAFAGTKKAFASPFIPAQAAVIVGIGLSAAKRT